MSANGDSGKLYHTKCTGDALITAEAHTADAPFTLFGSCFCPFVQRAWVALEYLGIPYKVSAYMMSCTASIRLDRLLSAVL